VSKPRLLVIGFRNEKSSDPSDAMEPWTPNGAGERLWKMVNRARSRKITKEAYQSRIEFVNVEPMGTDKVKAMMKGRCCVVLGIQAWRLLKMKRASFWYDCVDGAWLVPHPSGRDTIYNEVEAQTKTGKLITELI
jgi:hypothetical protein